MPANLLMVSVAAWVLFALTVLTRKFATRATKPTHVPTAAKAASARVDAKLPTSAVCTATVMGGAAAYIVGSTGIIHRQMPSDMQFMTSNNLRAGEVAVALAAVPCLKRGHPRITHHSVSLRVSRSLQ